MHQRLWLQRRRHFVVALLLYVAGLMGFGSLGSGPGPVFAAAGAMALAGLVTTSVIVMAAPALRRLCETSASGILAMAILLRQDAIHLDNGLTLGLGALGCALVLYVGLYGQWWGKTGMRFNWRTRRTFTADCPPAAAWARLIPDPTNPGAHYSGVFQGQDPVAGQPNRVIQRTACADGTTRETTLDIHEHHAPHQISYTYFGASEGTDYGRGHYKLTILPHNKKSRVRFSETVEGLIIPKALDLWFDDFGGEIRSAMTSALNARRDPSVWRHHSIAAHPLGAN